MAIESALEPGRFFHWRATSRLVHALEDVLGEIEHLEEGGERERALELYETFIAACYSKADELDDSSGIFGGFFDLLVEHWVGAADKLGIAGADIATKTCEWVEKDDYGYLDRSVEIAAKTVSTEGLADFPAVLRAVWETAKQAPPRGDGYPDLRHRVAADRLKKVLHMCRDFDAYLAFCNETELRADDCERLAELKEQAGDHQDALEWVEEGLKLSCERRYYHSKYELQNLKLRLLKSLGRQEDAQAFAWARFESSPSKSGYQELMELCPEGEKDEWHRRGLSLAEKHLGIFMELCVASESWDTMKEVLSARPDDDLMEIFYGTMEPVARAVAPVLPDVSARLFAVLAQQILLKAKAKLYHYACDYLLAARRGYQAASMDESWDQLVEAIKKKHFRKYRFMEGFEQVLDGTWGRPKPSFLDEAKSKWAKS
jgi:tetratricopeptide (TPR) repeat protein